MKPVHQILKLWFQRYIIVFRHIGVHKFVLHGEPSFPPQNLANSRECTSVMLSIIKCHNFHTILAQVKKIQFFNRFTIVKAPVVCILSSSACLRSEGYGTWSVCLSVTTFSATTRKETTKRAVPISSALHWLAFQFGDFRKSRELWRENWHRLTSTASAHSWRHKKLQRRLCIDSRMLSTTVASPCLVVRVLVARERRTTLRM